jgi:hypothetical protein
VTEANWSGLWELSGEFGFGGLAVLLSSFGFHSGWIDSISRQRIPYLEERSSTQDRLLSELRQTVIEMSKATKVKIKDKVDRNGRNEM